MQVEVFLQTPNFDVALVQAIAKFQEEYEEYENNMWHVTFTLVGVDVSYNFRREDYTYIFDVEVNE